MSVTKPIPVRLSASLIARLDLAAEKIHHSRAGIIRFCVETWLSHFERHGFAALPPDWMAILAEYDGRTQAGKAAAGAEGPTKSVEEQPGGEAPKKGQ